MFIYSKGMEPINEHEYSTYANMAELAEVLVTLWADSECWIEISWFCFQTAELQSFFPKGTVT